MRKKKTEEAKAKEAFSKLGDISELEFKLDDEGILTIIGFAIVDNVVLKIRIHRRNVSADESSTSSHKPGKTPRMYDGTISIIDPNRNAVMLSEAKKRKKEEKGKAYNDKDIYASIGYRCNYANYDEMASILMKRIETLIEENKDQLKLADEKYRNPELVTPDYAIKYADTFLSLMYPNSKDNSRRKNAIKSVFSGWQVPFSQLRKKDVESRYAEKKVTMENQKLLFDFTNYLSSTSKIVCKQVFPGAESREMTQAQLEKEAFTTAELSNDVFAEFFRLMNKTISFINCGIALMASGLSQKQILSLKWGDIRFMKGYSDFVIVPILRDDILEAKHDFSRPVIPDTALYLNEVYKSLCKKYAKEAVDEWYVAADDSDHSMPTDGKVLGTEARNLLVRAKYVPRPSKPGEKLDESMISFRCLQEFYLRMLMSKAGLANDDDTLYFLAGHLLKSSTFINYESHTSPEAQYRLYKVLKPCSVEHPIKKRVKNSCHNGMTTYEFCPDTNHEAVRITGKIVLKPGETLTIRIPSGVIGRIDVEESK